jgi:hypothetical protein
MICSKCGKEFQQTENQIKRHSYWCKKCIGDYSKEWNQNNKEKRNGIDKRYHVAHRDKKIIARRKSRQKERLAVLTHYTNGLIKCARCGFDDIRALCVDHIDGGGNKHRKEIGEGNLYSWIIKNKFPDGFQILCANCNMIKLMDEGEYKRVENF